MAVRVPILKTIDFLCNPEAQDQDSDDDSEGDDEPADARGPGQRGPSGGPRGQGRGRGNTVFFLGNSRNFNTLSNFQSHQYFVISLCIV